MSHMYPSGWSIKIGENAQITVIVLHLTGPILAILPCIIPVQRQPGLSAMSTAISSEGMQHCKMSAVQPGTSNAYCKLLSTKQFDVVCSCGG